MAGEVGEVRVTPGRGGEGRAHRYKAQAAAERAGALPQPPPLPTSPSPGVSSPLPGAPRDSEGGAQGVWGGSWGSRGGGLERPEPGIRLARPESVGSTGQGNQFRLSAKDQLVGVWC